MACPGFDPKTRFILPIYSTPGYALASQPGIDPPRPQRLVPYREARDWWTLEPEPAFPLRPSGARDGTLAPAWMERIESFVTLRTGGRTLAVYPLDGSGGRLAWLGASDVAPVPGGFRIHLQSDRQQLAPWYEIVTER